MVVPVRPYRSPLEVQSDFEIKRRQLTNNPSLVNTSPVPAAIQHNIQQHQKAPLPTYRVNSPGINIQPTVNINIQNIIKSFEDPFGEEETHSTDMPWVYDGALKMMHNFGYAMLRDDSHDIGYFKYTARRGYRAHPSRLHHWYIGTGLMLIAQMGGILHKAREFMEAGSELSELGGLGLEELESPQSQQLPPIRLYGNHLQNTPPPSLPPPQPPASQPAALPLLPERGQVIEYTPASQTKRLTVPSAPRL